jgi:hypothetical protein
MRTAAERSRILYQQAIIDDGCRAWLAKEHRNADLFSLQLRGYALLCGPVLQHGLAQLITQNRHRNEIIEALVVEACVDPVFYYEAIQLVPADRERLVLEYHEYSRQRGRPSAGGMQQLKSLNRHLVRTGGWGSPYELLRGYVARHKIIDPANQIEFLRFLRDGYEEARKKWLSIIRRSILGRRIVAICPEFATAWEKLETCVRIVKGELEQPNGLPDPIFEALDRLEASRAEFVRAIDMIAVQPHAAVEAARLTAATMLGTSEVLQDVEVHSACPSLAILQNELTEILIEILRNAEKYNSPGGMRDVSLKFLPAGSGGYVIMEVYQPGPWKDTNRRESGLQRIRELLSIYDATLDVNKTAVVGKPCMTVTLCEWSGDA